MHVRVVARWEVVMVGFRHGLEYAASMRSFKILKKTKKITSGWHLVLHDKNRTKKVSLVISVA